MSHSRPLLPWLCLIVTSCVDARNDPVLTSRCYRSSKLLASEAPGASSRIGFGTGDNALLDSTWAYFRLDSAGRASRTMLGRDSSRWRNSQWQADGDTLTVRLTTGTYGWSLVLVKNLPNGGYTGTATYLTDVATSGWSPSQLPITVRPSPCP